VWEPDRKLYALLLCVWALLLVASLATVSPEEMYLVNQNELRILLEISDTLKTDSENLKAEAQSWRQTSETLETELENSTIELTALQGELSWQKKRFSELQQSLENSAKLAEELAQSAKESAMRANDLEQYTTQLVKDLSKSNKERNLWRIVAMVAGSLAAIGWTMILYYP
jgi:septal ring factor EnvC (AmiA/AmiB activator)